MTATLYSSSTLNSGLREFGSVTNTFAGYLQSGGVAYDLTLPWQADKFEWFNYTKYATGGNNAQGVWFRDFPSGDALIISTTPTTVKETTNGVTINNSSGGFTDEHVTITGITAATPGVVTAAGHGLANGDRVIITKVVGSIGATVNNKSFVVQGVTSTTFQLYDVFGNAYTTSGTYTSGGQLNKEGPELGVVNSPVTYRLTLGTAVMGADNDVIYFVASKFNSYQNLGDVA
jgi:hypothetical protein